LGTPDLREPGGLGLPTSGQRDQGADPARNDFDVARPALRPDDEAFWSAVRALPKRQAQTAALRYLYDLSVAEVAETLDISEGSVKQHLSRARGVLVKQLQLDSGQVSGLDAEEER
jgi:DNA-directed RNA polymerase specialized sigma24 family protein